MERPDIEQWVKDTREVLNWIESIQTEEKRDLRDFVTPAENPMMPQAFGQGDSYKYLDIDKYGECCRFLYIDQVNVSLFIYRLMFAKYSLPVEIIRASTIKIRAQLTKEELKFIGAHTDLMFRDTRYKYNETIKAGEASYRLNITWLFDYLKLHRLFFPEYTAILGSRAAYGSILQEIHWLHIDEKENNHQPASHRGFSHFHERFQREAVSITKQPPIIAWDVKVPDEWVSVYRP